MCETLLPLKLLGDVNARQFWGKTKLIFYIFCSPLFKKLPAPLSNPNPNPNPQKRFRENEIRHFSDKCPDTGFKSYFQGLCELDRSSASIPIPNSLSLGTG